jgi:DNA (cytosine-5)-methyltransferase 1
MNELATIPSTDHRMRELALFAGAGGGILGGHLLGWRTVCAVERDAFAAAVLAQRQNDGCLLPFPIWSDVETFDGRPWRGIVDVISGGFPCTDISCAGKGAGIEGAESGLWREMWRIIGEVRPRHVLVENSPMLTLRGLGTVLGDLASLGYDARWGVLSAADAIWFECLSRDDRPTLDHLRERIWIVATLSVAESDGDRTGLCQDGQERYRHQPPDVCSDAPASADATLDGRRQGDANTGWMPEGSGSREKYRPWDVCQIDATLGRLAVQWWTPRHARHPDGIHATADATSHGVHGVHGDTTGERSAWNKSKQELDQRDASANDQFQRLERIERTRPETRPVDRSGNGHHPGWWATEPDVGRLVHGLADRVDRCKALGNGQVPAVVRLAWRMLTDPTTGATP